MKKTKEIQDKKLNARLYPIYKMLSWDLLFYYSIIYLFLTQAKGFSASQVLLSEAFFTASCLIMQIPIGLLVDRFGKKNSLVFANICMCIFTIILLFVQNYNQLLIAFFVDAVGYVIKGICETNILYDSLPSGKKRGGLYSLIDGRGASWYYVLDSVTALIAGFTFVINPYIPIILCLIANILSAVLSTRFRHTQMPDDEKEKRIGVRKYLKQLKESIRFTQKSKRISCLLIFFGIISGLLYNMTTFRSGILEQIQIPEQYFGIVFAMSQIAASICSKMQGVVHRRYRNKTLSYLGIPLTSSCIIIGLFAMVGTGFINVFAIMVLFIMQGAIKGAYNVLIYRYLNNFTNKHIRIKLATIRNMIYNVCTICISLFGALLLNYTNAANTIIIIGSTVTISIIILLDYMRNKVGLKPNEYNKEDLKYSKLSPD
ncbi:MAG: MFS transporter [Clostridia bacterium]|nr:MFS transporter [Clostridia bacterium]